MQKGDLRFIEIMFFTGLGSTIALLLIGIYLLGKFLLGGV